jgi:hypothetical protein
MESIYNRFDVESELLKILNKKLSTSIFINISNFKPSNKFEQLLNVGKYEHDDLFILTKFKNDIAHGIKFIFIN